MSFISIHAPAWGATRRYRFQRAYRSISIHAPAWGATQDGPTLSKITGFQSTRPRGARLPSCKVVQLTQRFQSTRPRGARRSLCMQRLSTADFNPRARVGRDLVVRAKNPASRISIHAPAWGATDAIFKAIAQIRISIHAPAWGATG